MNRQVKWQRKKVKKGLCNTCGKRKLFTKYDCKICSKKKNKLNKRWREAHLDYMKKYTKRWREAHLDYMKKYGKKYYKRLKEK